MTDMAKQWQERLLVNNNICLLEWLVAGGLDKITAQSLDVSFQLETLTSSDVSSAPFQVRDYTCLSVQSVWWTSASRV